jgi:hypothetical protein
MSSDELFERLMVGGGLRRDVEGQQRVFWGLWLRPLQCGESRAGADAERQMRQRREGGVSAAALLCRAICSVSETNVLRRLGGFIRKTF